MESREKILELVRRFEVIPAGHEDILRSWIVDLNHALDQVFGPDSQYISYLKYIKFRPDVVFVTEKERERSWKEGAAQVDNLLHVILNDPKVSDQIVFDPVPVEDIEDASSEDRIRQSLEEFREAAARQIAPLLNSDGPLREPLRNVAPIAQNIPQPEVPGQGTELSGSGGGNHQQALKVLCVTGSNAAINEEILKFLNDLPANVLSIPKAAGQETLVDRLNHCSGAEFVVFVLSPDFHVYSKTQRPVDGGLMASQEAVFELGFLAAKFGRQNVVVLYEESEDFIRPTEFFDLFYVPVTSSAAWKSEVIRRMKGNLAVAAGLGISVEDRTRL